MFSTKKRTLVTFLQYHLSQFVEYNCNQGVLRKMTLSSNTYLFFFEVGVAYDGPSVKEQTKISFSRPYFWREKIKNFIFTVSWGENIKSLYFLSPKTVNIKFFYFLPQETAKIKFIVYYFLFHTWSIVVTL